MAVKKAELSVKWWKSQKPALLRNTDLLDALKQYEMADDKMDYDLIELTLRSMAKRVNPTKEKLEKLRGDYSGLIAELDKFGGSTRDGLIKTRFNKNAANKKAYEKNNPTGAPPKQKLGKKVIIWKADFKDYVGNELQSYHWIEKVPSMPLFVRLDKSILDVLEKDRVDKAVTAFMVEDAQAAFQASVKQMKSIVKTASSKAYTDFANAKKIQKQAIKDVIAEYEACGAIIQEVPPTRWKKYTASNAAYKSYKAENKKAFAKGTAILATTGAGIYLSAGALSAFSVASTLRTLNQLGKQFADFMAKTEHIEVELLEELEKLEDRYKWLGKYWMSKAMVGQREAGVSALNALVGADQPFFKSISSSNRLYDLWSDKVATLTVKGAEMSAKVTGAINDVNVLEEAFKKAEGKFAYKSFKLLKATRKDLDKALKNCSKMNERVRQAELKSKKIKNRLKELNDRNHPWAKTIDKGLGLLADAVFVGGGWVESRADIRKVEVISLLCAGTVTALHDQYERFK